MASKKKLLQQVKIARTESGGKAINYFFLSKTIIASREVKISDSALYKGGLRLYGFHGTSVYDPR